MGTNGFQEPAVDFFKDGKSFGTKRLYAGWPLPFLELNLDEMKELRLNPGDLVEVYNDNGSTQATAQPRPTAKRKQTFMLFAYPTGTWKTSRQEASTS